MPDVRCSNCNTLLQPRHYEKGKCFNCDNSIKDYEKVLLKNEGKSLKKMLLSISSIVVILFLYGFISIYGSSIKESISSFLTKSPIGSVHSGTPKVTKAQFDQLKTGMSLSQVKSIIGGDCAVQSESGDIGSQFHTVMYGCDGKGQLGANINFVMQSGKLISKAQFGLK